VQSGRRSSRSRSRSMCLFMPGTVQTHDTRFSRLADIRDQTTEIRHQTYIHTDRHTSGTRSSHAHTHTHTRVGAWEDPGSPPGHQSAWVSEPAGDERFSHGWSTIISWTPRVWVEKRRSLRRGFILFYLFIFYEGGLRGGGREMGWMWMNDG